MALNDVKEIVIPECKIGDSELISSTLNTNNALSYVFSYATTGSLNSLKSIRIKGKINALKSSYSWIGLWYYDENGNQINITPSAGTSTDIDITCYLNTDGWVTGYWNLLVIGGEYSSKVRRLRLVINKTTGNNIEIYTSSNNSEEIVTLQINSVEITTKSIRDSNGNIIWGSQSAYPYRRLEYIKFSGTENVLTDHKPTTNRYYYLDFEIASKINDKFILGANGDITSAGAMRVTVRTSASYFQCRYGRNSSGNLNIGTTCDINTFYQLRFRIFSGSNIYAAIADANGSVLGSTTVAAVSFTTNNMNPFAIMGYNNGGTVGNMTAGRVYRYFYRIGDASGNIGSDCYPCQRKSDNVCGLYDVVNNTFYPMSGTNITSAAAGPLVSEYWDMTN